MVGPVGNDDVVAQRPQWQTTMVREARAGPEFASFALTAGPLLAASRRGDGHAVLVLPGLGATDASTAPLRWFLDRLGYRSFGWGLGRNGGFGRYVTDGLDELLAAKGETGRVSLVGWSLGGVHAIELARRRPDAVRSIVTLGSPLVGRHHPPVGIPSTSVYSRTDSIVAWRASLLPTRPLHENVEVRGSHLGLGHNPAVAVVVADRLAQQRGHLAALQAASLGAALVARRVNTGRKTAMTRSVSAASRAGPSGRCGKLRLYVRPARSAGGVEASSDRPRAVGPFQARRPTRGVLIYCSPPIGPRRVGYRCGAPGRWLEPRVARPHVATLGSPHHTWTVAR